MRVPFRIILALLLAAIVAGCGFQLRGTLSGSLPYKTLYIALPETADVRIWMQRYINASGQTRIVDNAKDAEAVFQQLQDSRIKTILSVNAQGRELVGSNEINLSRDITYDDSTVLAKDLEEGLLWRDMNNDLVNQIIRRLSIIKPKNPDLEEDD